MADCNDECPNDPNKIAPGFCDCGMPDDDLNDDGLPDCYDMDLCPDDPYKRLPGICGCGVPDEDLDNDGVTELRLSRVHQRPSQPGRERPQTRPRRRLPRQPFSPSGS